MMRWLKRPEAAIATHELIKIKLLESCEMDRYEVAEKLAKAADAEVAQILGRTILLYRQGEKPKIELPQEIVERLSR